MNDGATPATGAGLPEVQLPPPDAMEARLRDGRWHGSLHESGPVLHAEDGTGDAVWLIRHDDGRALLLTYDDEAVDVYFRASAHYFGEPETDLLAGAPAWWDEDLETHLDGLRGPEAERAARWVTGIFGYEHGRWSMGPGSNPVAGTRSFFDPVAVPGETVTPPAGVRRADDTPFSPTAGPTRPSATPGLGRRGTAPRIGRAATIALLAVIALTTFALKSFWADGLARPWNVVAVVACYAVLFVAVVVVLVWAARSAGE